MLRRTLGCTGISIPAVAVSTWTIGGIHWREEETALVIDAMHAALDEGIDLIETAPAHGFGLAEHIVRRVLADRVGANVRVATRCGLDWATGQGAAWRLVDGRQVWRSLRPDRVRRQVEASLGRLGVDRIDLIQVGQHDPETPAEDTVGELLRLRDEGKVGAIGTCDLPPFAVREYLRAGCLDCHQVPFSMLDRDVEIARLQGRGNRRVPILASHPLAMGLLAGQFAVGMDREERDPFRATSRFSTEALGKAASLLDRFEPFRQKYGLTQRQLALAWTIAQPGIACVLVGLMTPEHVREVAGGAVRLNSEDLEAMDALIAESGLLEPAS